MIPSRQTAIYVLIAASSLLMAAFQPNPMGAAGATASARSAGANLRAHSDGVWWLTTARLASLNGLHP